MKLGKAMMSMGARPTSWTAAMGMVEVTAARVSHRGHRGHTRPVAQE